MLVYQRVYELDITNTTQPLISDLSTCETSSTELGREAGGHASTRKRWHLRPSGTGSPIFKKAIAIWRFQWGYPQSSSIWCSDFPLQTIQLLGYPHDYGNPWGWGKTYELRGAFFCARMRSHEAKQGVKRVKMGMGMNGSKHTVDGRNPASPWTLDGWNPIDTGMFTTYQLVQDFFHPAICSYFKGWASINPSYVDVQHATRYVFYFSVDQGTMALTHSHWVCILQYLINGDLGDNLWHCFTHIIYFGWSENDIIHYNTTKYH